MSKFGEEYVEINGFYMVLYGIGLIVYVCKRLGKIRVRNFFSFFSFCIW